MTPYNYQIETASELFQSMLSNGGFTYLAGKPRFGKTLSALLAYEHSKRVKSILIICPKKAIPGWKKFTQDEELLSSHLTKQYTVVNYEALGSYKMRTHSKHGKLLAKPKKELHLKVNPDDFEAVILDEAHNYGKVGKPAQRYFITQAVVQDKPIILLSGTAQVENGGLGIYHQMTLSTKGPFKHDNFYRFFEEFGMPVYMFMHGREIMQYKQALPTLQEVVKQFTIYKTQFDAGIDATVQAVDNLHYVELTARTKQYYNQLQTDRILPIKGHTIVADSIMKLRTSLHQLESGVTKIEDEYFLLGNTEKVDFIKNKWGDHKTMGIMCNFIGEQKLLKKHFEHAVIYSSTAHAEGVDLSHLEHFIILSHNYSGSKFVQLRERIINTEGSISTTVNFILVENGISQQAYESCSKKLDFNNETYKQKALL